MCSSISSFFRAVLTSFVHCFPYSIQDEDIRKASSASSSPTTFTTETNPSAPTIYGKLRYVSAGHVPKPSTKPYGIPDLSEFQDERMTPLHDLRPLSTVDTEESKLQLSSRGFTAINHPSTMHSPPYTDANWRDPDFLKNVYAVETEEMMKRITGAQTVIVEAILIRNSSKDLQEPTVPSPSTGGEHSDPPTNTKEQQATPKPKPSGLMKLGFPQIIGFAPHIGALPPAPKVHLDYAPPGARTHIRHSHPTVSTACARIIAAEDRLLDAGLSLSSNYSSSTSAPRWAIYSVWRPLKPVKRDPLAVGNMRTFAAEDYVMVDTPGVAMDAQGMVKEMHTLKFYVGRAREGHQWWYVSEQKPEEVLIVRFWDSDREGDTVGAGGVMHSSVELEGREKEEARESVELRCLAIW